jgi:hypothetical protein
MGSGGGGWRASSEVSVRDRAEMSFRMHVGRYVSMVDERAVYS